ncbi:hypothetical protein ACO2Q3_11750 [Caulobacter sp. KR2-114]|uniref:hypothetical protein n=1 Tax=Caulobacter sp. KR2-114 TaxID=3400912 RepID=UPI003C100430
MRTAVTMLASMLIAVGLSSSPMAATSSGASSAAKPAAAKPAKPAKPAASPAAAATPAPAVTASKGTPVLNAQGKCVDSVTKRFVDSKLCAAKPAGGPGKGVKCGNSYIAAGKKCTKPS